MGQSHQHKQWSQAKDLAFRLYNQGISKGDFLNQAMGQEAPTNPMKFDERLGPQLDVVVTLHEKRHQAVQKESPKANEIEEALFKAGKEARQSLVNYLKQCDALKEELDKVDDKIYVLLHKTLLKIGSDLMKFTAKNSQAVHEVAGEFQTHHKKWEAAKKESESAFKALLKDKERAKVLKTAKLDSYPLKFSGGMGPCLEKIYKKLKVLNTDEGKMAIAELRTTATDYEAAVNNARNKFRLADFKGKEVDEVFAPLSKVLKELLEETKGV
jgi:gas vesicle protein